VKRIYTFGGKPAERNLTVHCARQNKEDGIKMVQVSAATAEEAEACERAGVDMIAASDHNVAAVRDGAPTTFIIASLRMTEYITEDNALAAAIRALELGADAIYTPRGLSTVERLANEGIAVQGHVGLVPRLSTQVGGMRVIGKTADEAMKVFSDVKRFEDAGGAAVEAELVAVEALEEISKRTSLITHSIGSGSGGDVIFSFMQDICGDVERPPRHARAWADMRSVRRLEAVERAKGVDGFTEAVRLGTFPDAKHTVPMPREEHDLFLASLDT
jgi:3-methyl-2-oxobutanoate hydroxymethyltransferase